MKLALLIVDMQKAFLQEVEPAVVKSALEYINYTAKIMRNAGCTIVHIQDIADAEELGMEQLAFSEDVTIAEADLHVTKLYNNAFWQTDLQSLLSERQIDFVVVAGYAAEYCVLFTYNGAVERGFKTAMLQGGLASSKSDAITSAYRDRHLISYSVIQAILKG